MKNLPNNTDLESTVKKHVKITNQKIKALEGASGKMFDAVKTAITAFDNNKKAVKLYRNSLDSNHRSTISMMIRVASNELIRENETKLPTSYQTLNELIKLINELNKTDDTSFVSLIQNGKIYSEMSKADVINLRTEIREENATIAYKTVDLKEENSVQLSKETKITEVKIPDLEQLEEFVSNLDNEKRQLLIELLTSNKNDVKEAA